MAPRSRTSSRKTNLENVRTINNLGKISKAKTALPKTSLGAKARELACKEVLVNQEAEKKTVVETCPELPQKSSKRKRNEFDSEDESDLSVVLESKRVACVKKLRFQLPTPPHSQHNTDNEASSPEKSTFPVRRTVTDLPEALQHWISLHAALLKALSLHFAHNGAPSPAEITALTTSMTRIWKKSKVTLVDLQRMLALYELEDPDVKGREVVDQKRSPFKLTHSGFGTATRTNLEFCGSAVNRYFQERRLQDEYEQSCFRIFDSLNTDELSLIHQSTVHGPRLSVEVGIQTQSRQLKTAAVRTAILSKAEIPSAQSGPDLSRLSISDQQVNQTPTSVKNRTLSLFDRVRAKGIANSSVATPTSEQLTRRHAIGRAPEIVEFLRMKQSQKQFNPSSFLNQEDLDTGSSFRRSQSLARQSSKISFSLSQIVREIRESVPVPVSANEVQVVLRILATELPELRGWIQVIELGSLVSVTLNGTPSNINGAEIGRLLKTKEEMTV